MAERRIAIGVDVGGSAIKAGAVDVEAGRLLGERIKVPTPEPSTPSAVVDTIQGLVKQLAKAAGAAARVGIGIPSVVGMRGRAIDRAHGVIVRGRDRSLRRDPGFHV